MRSFKSPAGHPVALASRAQDCAKLVLDLGRRLAFEAFLEPALEREDSVRERRVRPARLALTLDQRDEPVNSFKPRGGDRDARLPICSSSPSNRARDPSRIWNR